MGQTLLDVTGLRTHFIMEDRVVRSVDDVSFSVDQGETLCIVGESGSGKSVTARSILGLVDPPGRVVSGSAHWFGPGTSDGATDGPVDLLALDPKSEEMRRMRGNRIAMVFQEPMASLSPMYTIGDHIVEAIRLHRKVSRKEAWREGVVLLDKVGIRRPEERMRAYSFQLSGGMCQRAMIAIALCCSPELLIADEPTTALDVTTQQTILRLLQDLQSEFGMAIIFITHDLGVVAEIADRVVVMRHGKIVEHGEVDQIFHAPAHAYTRQLLDSIPLMTRFDAQEGQPA